MTYDPIHAATISAEPVSLNFETHARSKALVETLERMIGEHDAMASTCLCMAALLGDAHGPDGGRAIRARIVADHGHILPYGLPGGTSPSAMDAVYRGWTPHDRVMGKLLMRLCVKGDNGWCIDDAIQGPGPNEHPAPPLAHVVVRPARPSNMTGPAGRAWTAAAAAARAAAKAPKHHAVGPISAMAARSGNYPLKLFQDPAAITAGYGAAAAAILAEHPGDRLVADAVAAATKTATGRIETVASSRDAADIFPLHARDIARKTPLGRLIIDLHAWVMRSGDAWERLTVGIRTQVTTWYVRSFERACRSAIAAARADADAERADRAVASGAADADVMRRAAAASRAAAAAADDEIGATPMAAFGSVWQCAMAAYDSWVKLDAVARGESIRKSTIYAKSLGRIDMPAADADRLWSAMEAIADAAAGESVERGVAVVPFWPKHLDRRACAGIRSVCSGGRITMSAIATASIAIMSRGVEKREPWSHPGFRRMAEMLRDMDARRVDGHGDREALLVRVVSGDMDGVVGAAHADAIGQSAGATFTPPALGFGVSTRTASSSTTTLPEIILSTRLDDVPSPLGGHVALDGTPMLRVEAAWVGSRCAFDIHGDRNRAFGILPHASVGSGVGDIDADRWRAVLARAAGGSDDRAAILAAAAAMAAKPFLGAVGAGSKKIAAAIAVAKTVQDFADIGRRAAGSADLAAAARPAKAELQILSPRSSMDAAGRLLAAVLDRADRVGIDVGSKAGRAAVTTACAGILGAASKDRVGCWLVGSKSGIRVAAAMNHGKLAPDVHRRLIAGEPDADAVVRGDMFVGRISQARLSLHVNADVAVPTVRLSVAINADRPAPDGMLSKGDVATLAAGHFLPDDDGQKLNPCVGDRVAAFDKAMGSDEPPRVLAGIARRPARVIVGTHDAGLWPIGGDRYDEIEVVMSGRGKGRRIDLVHRRVVADGAPIGPDRDARMLGLDGRSIDGSIAACREGRSAMHWLRGAFVEDAAKAMGRAIAAPDADDAADRAAADPIVDAVRAIVPEPRAVAVAAALPKRVAARALSRDPAERDGCADDTRFETAASLRMAAFGDLVRPVFENLLHDGERAIARMASRLCRGGHGFMMGTRDLHWDGDSVDRETVDAAIDRAIARATRDLAASGPRASAEIVVDRLLLPVIRVIWSEWIMAVTMRSIGMVSGTMNQGRRPTAETAMAAEREAIRCGFASLDEFNALLHAIGTADPVGFPLPNHPLGRRAWSLVGKNLLCDLWERVLSLGTAVCRAGLPPRPRETDMRARIGRTPGRRGRRPIPTDDVAGFWSWIADARRGSIASSRDDIRRQVAVIVAERAKAAGATVLVVEALGADRGASASRHDNAMADVMAAGAWRYDIRAACAKMGIAPIFVEPRDTSRLLAADPSAGRAGDELAHRLGRGLWRHTASAIRTEDGDAVVAVDPGEVADAETDAGRRAALFGRLFERVSDAGGGPLHSEVNAVWTIAERFRDGWTERPILAVSPVPGCGGAVFTAKKPVATVVDRATGEKQKRDSKWFERMATTGIYAAAGYAGDAQTMCWSRGADGLFRLVARTRVAAVVAAARAAANGMADGAAMDIVADGADADGTQRWIQQDVWKKLHGIMQRLAPPRQRHALPVERHTALSQRSERILAAAS